MRIISGTYKGKRITAPKKLPVRPTTDFAKEGLFNILHHRIHFQETTFLDLFSGTGNISFEFASRGCQNIISVDQHYGCVSFIHSISEELDFSIKTVKADVFKYLAKTTHTVDVIFADPPYAFEISKFEKIISEVFNNKLLNKEGFLIIEHSKQTKLDQNTYFFEARRYGGSVFSFFKEKNADL